MFYCMFYFTCDRSFSKMPLQVLYAPHLAGGVDAGEVEVGVDGADDGAQRHHDEQYDHHRFQHLRKSSLPATPTSRRTGRTGRLSTEQCALFSLGDY